MHGLHRVVTDARLSRSVAAATLGLVSGQASTDYAAVLLVVLAVVAGTATWADGDAIADGVQHAFARALCVARGGDCDVDALPCVTASDEQRDETSVKLVLLRFEGRTALLREMRSDGTVLITKGTLAAPGLTGSVGAKGHLSVGGIKLAAGAQLEGSALGLFERSRSWVVPGEEAADRLVAMLQRHRGAVRQPGVAHPDPPPPDYSSDSHGLSATIGASGSAGRVAATLGLSARDVRGVRVQRATGQRTLYLERSDSGGVSLTAVDVGVRGQQDTLERYGITLDRDGRPLDLVVLRQGTLQVAADLPRRLQSVAGLLSTPTKGERMWSEETHLDLTDPANLVLARSFLAQVTGGPVTRFGSRVEIARALVGRLDAVGVEHVRTMAVDSSAIGAGGEIGAGLRVGGSYDRTTIHRDLLDAATRGIDGVWRRRTDCLEARAKPRARALVSLRVPA